MLVVRVGITTQDKVIASFESENTCVSKEDSHWLGCTVQIGSVHAQCMLVIERDVLDVVVREGTVLNTHTPSTYDGSDG